MGTVAGPRLAVRGRSLPRSMALIQHGRIGDYNIGGNRALPNLEVVHRILAITRPESWSRGCRIGPDTIGAMRSPATR